MVQIPKPLIIIVRVYKNYHSTSLTRRITAKEIMNAKIIKLKVSLNLLPCFPNLHPHIYKQINKLLGLKKSTSD